MAVAKSNKKFAIMHISDGNERVEILLWSDLLNEFHHLVVENKLLAAVLVVDKRESPIKVQCRFLADLAQMNETEENQVDEALKKANDVDNEGYLGLSNDLKGDVLNAMGKKEDAKKAYLEALKRFGPKDPYARFTQEKLEALGV